jgi:tetratricopeptide (TPR) repeat protein
MLTPAEIAAEIAQDMEFLQKELRDLPQRQRSLRSVFNHSWQLLSEDQRHILAALSIFRGGFRREAARDVAGASLGDLMGLIDKSMLQRVADGRFEVHELIRQFAAEQLGKDPERETDTHSKHSETYLQALAGWERDLQGPRQIEANQEIKLEIDNIRAAWTWAVETQRIQALTGAINGFCIYLFQNHQRIEGQELCQVLIKRLKAARNPGESTHLKLQARALAWAAYFNWKLGYWDRSRELLQDCQSIQKGHDLVKVETRFERALVNLTQTMITENIEHSELVKTIQDIEALFTAIDEPWWAGQALTIMGGRTEATEAGMNIIEKSLQITRKLGDLQSTADALYQLSVHHALKWQLDKAMALAYEALEIYQALGDQHKMAKSYAGLGGGMVWQGRFEEARSIECKTLEMYADLGYQQSFFAYAYVAAAYPELYLGEYQAAREQSQFALDIYQEVKHEYARHWTALTHDILGRAALGEGDFTEAETWFLKVDPVFQESYNLGEVANYCQNLACLGFTKRGLKQISQAFDFLYQALLLATQFESYLAIFHILPGIAALLADHGKVERAVEIYALAATQGIVANSKWFEEIAGDAVARAAEVLPEKVVEAAKARGRELDLWETAEGLLVELEQAGWGEEVVPSSGE